MYHLCCTHYPCDETTDEGKRDLMQESKPNNGRKWRLQRIATRGLGYIPSTGWTRVIPISGPGHPAHGWPTWLDPTQGRIGEEREGRF